MKIFNKTKNLVVSENAEMANNFIKKAFGLMFEKNLEENYALIIPKCKQIHMFFMKIKLDILFLDKDNICIFMLENFEEWKVSPYVGDSHNVIELPAGTIKKHNIELGDSLEITNL